MYSYILLAEYKCRTNVYISYLRDGGGSISSVELGQVMKTFGWTPSEIELQVGYFKVLFVTFIGIVGAYK